MRIVFTTSGFDFAELSDLTTQFPQSIQQANQGEGRDTGDHSRVLRADGSAINDDNAEVKT